MKHSSPLPAHPPFLTGYLAKATPPSWRQFRHEERDAYEELCTALKRRQRGLCAFCEIDLVTSVGTPAREVEHWRPKSHDAPGASLWTFGIGNLQLGCLGGSNRYPLADLDRTGDPLPGPNRSCGAFKGNNDPLDGVAGIEPYRPQDLPEHPAMFDVDDEGGLRPIADCDNFGMSAARLWSTIDFLGLNCTRLKNARRAIRQGLDTALTDYLEDAAGGTDDERFDAAYEFLTRDTAPLGDERLPRFVTTLRSFFGRGLDNVLFPVPGWSVAA